MSQKVNPTVNKLNVVEIGNYSFHKYGRNFRSYKKSVNPRNYIFNYVNRFCIKYNLLLENVDMIQTPSKTFILIHILNFRNKTNFKIKKYFLRTASGWFRDPILLSFFKNINFGNSSFLIVSYVNHLFKTKINAPKKIIQSVYSFLKSQSEITKVKYTVSGITLMKLKGFKLEISGCFDSTRSQMAKKLKCNFGQVPLTSLKGYIDYSSHTLFTKSGSCGFKIWLFYEFKSP